MSTAKRKKRSSSLKGSLNPSKRHRDRFNIELDNLAKLLPFPHDVIQKLDKLSILRLSASYLRAKNFFKGQQWTEDNQVGKVVDGNADFEGNGVFSKLLLDALDGFVIVLTRDFEVFYASETVQDYLGLAQASVIHQDFLRFIHVDDHDLIRKNLQPFPEDEEEQKIRILDEENDGTASETGSTCSGDDGSKSGDDVETERSFVCRMKCILNTSAGFFKPFRCSGRLREMTLPDSEKREYGLFMICTPLETVSSSMLEIRLKTSLFCTKNRMDLSFMDIDQKGRSLLGYHKRDIALQSSYCMIHFDDIPVLQTLHNDLMTTGKCQGTFRMLNKNLKWQWLTGTAQVVFKGNEPDFIITTNRPLSDEEGEEILRQRGQFPALPFTASDCGSPSPRSPGSPASIGSYRNGGSPQAVPWDRFSVKMDTFKFPNMPTKYPNSNGRVKKKPPQQISDDIAKSPASGATSPMEEDLPPSPQHPGSPFPDALLSSTSCTSAPLSPPLLDLGVDIQAELEKDAPDLDFALLDPQELSLDDFPLEPLENVSRIEEMASSMSLLAVDPPTYEEAIRLATECLSSSSSGGLTSPDGSHPSLSQSPPQGNLEHFPAASPYPSPGYPSPHMSPGNLPTPDPSPIGNSNPSTASVNISWQGMGQMKVSSQPQQHCPPQQNHLPYSTIPSPQPPIQVPSKSALISAEMKKREKSDTYHRNSCISGQSPNPMTSPRRMQNMPGQSIPSNWQQQVQSVQHQPPTHLPHQQGYEWKAPQVHTGNHMPYFPGERTATATRPDNPVYATNMQGRNWTVPPLFEDTLPPLECDSVGGYMKTGQNVQGHLQHHSMDPSILSPPYQEDFHSGFTFQGNPLPAMSQGQTTLGHW